MRVVVAFEQPAPNLVVFFSQFERVVIYPLNPPAVLSYCRSLAVSNVHCSRTDAAMIARYSFWLAAGTRTSQRPDAPSAQPCLNRLQNFTFLRHSSNGLSLFAQAVQSELNRLMLPSTSSLVLPVETISARSGEYAEKPVGFGSMMT